MERARSTDWMDAVAGTLAVLLWASLATLFFLKGSDDHE